jgi:hypothetical protein
MSSVRKLAPGKGSFSVAGFHEDKRPGRLKKGRSAKPVTGNKLRKSRPKSLDEIIAESNVTPWTDSDFEWAAEIGEGLFDGFAEQVRRWRDAESDLGS